MARLDTSKLGESPYSNDTKGWEVFEQKMKENTSYHEAIVDIPEYDYKKDFCSFKVYFLECNVVKIRVNCKSPGLPYDEYQNCDNPSYKLKARNLNMSIFASVLLFLNKINIYRLCSL